MGIRSKIMAGFLSLGVLLLFSGLISYFELSELGRTTSKVLDSSSRNIEFSKKMLDAVQDQNTALLHIEVLGLNDYDTMLIAANDRFNKAIQETGFFVYDLPGLESIYTARSEFNRVVLEHMSDTLSREGHTRWFVETYKTSYYELTSAIKNFMIASQKDMEVKTEELRDNAYRAIMPGIIALSIGILIIFIFYYFIDLYYVSPILKMKRGLDNYFNHGLPFSLEVEGRDEIVKLKEYIDQLIKLIKSKKAA